LVKSQGARRFVRLSRTPVVVPTGSTVDATRGRVGLTSATRSSKVVNSGVFYGGEFKVTQARGQHGLTDLQLVGGGCRAAAHRKPSATFASGSSGIRRLLHSSTHGSFRTRGQRAAASSLGTKWLTEDRCDGTTYFAAERGSVQPSVPNNDLNLAALAPGNSAVFYCHENGRPPVPGSFCTVAVSQNGAFGAIGAVIVYYGSNSSYDLFITEPNSTVDDFSMVPFPSPGANGRRSANIACPPFAGPGNYTFRWRVNGVLLGPPLPASSPSSFGSPSLCVFTPAAPPVPNL
jgi:hypothetical protein